MTFKTRGLRDFRLTYRLNRKRPAAPYCTAGMRIQSALELDLTADGCFELGLVGFVSALLLAVGADAVGVT